MKAGKSHLAEGPVGEEPGIWKRFRQALILVEPFGGGRAGSGSSQSREGARTGSVLALKHQKNIFKDFMIKIFLLPLNSLVSKRARA